ncbi:hypothetical protein M758_UG304500 [Ceratodon purpureus]|nr:hypothetical protein M758_UG304500 [Ceratodon purpureus]
MRNTRKGDPQSRPLRRFRRTRLPQKTPILKVTILNKYTPFWMRVHGTVNPGSPRRVLPTEAVQANQNYGGSGRIRVHSYIDCTSDKKRKTEEKESAGEKANTCTSGKLKGLIAEESVIDVSDDEDEEEEVYLSLALSEDANTDNRRSNAVVEGVAQGRGVGNAINFATSGLGGVSRNAVEYNLYTPLQKWEYENGLPVYGVSDVLGWALDVGLAGNDDDEDHKAKKMKMNEPPKYAGSTCRIMLNSAEEQDTPAENKNDAEAQEEMDAYMKSKGKKKM